MNVVLNQTLEALTGITSARIGIPAINQAAERLINRITYAQKDIEKGILPQGKFGAFLLNLSEEVAQEKSAFEETLKENNKLDQHSDKLDALEKAAKSAKTLRNKFNQVQPLK